MGTQKVELESAREKSAVAWEPKNCRAGARGRESTVRTPFVHLFIIIIIHNNIHLGPRNFRACNSWFTQATDKSYKVVPLRASLIASSNRCAMHHIQNTHSNCPSTRPLSPETAMLAAAPSVPTPTSFLHSSGDTSWMPRPCKLPSNTWKRPRAVTDWGQLTVRKSILVWTFSSLPSGSHHTTSMTSLSILPLSVAHLFQGGHLLRVYPWRH